MQKLKVCQTADQSFELKPAEERMLGAVAEFLVYIIESFTGSVIENYSPTGFQEADDDRGLLEEDNLADFTRFDSRGVDTVFQEFDPPAGHDGKMAWKLSRPPSLKFLVTCFKTVFKMQFVFGSSIGLLAIAIAVLDFNTADLCYEKTAQWYSMPRVIQSIRVTSQSIEGFFIQLWHFSIMLCIFGFSFMKELNLFTVNLLAAFTDCCYRLYLQIFGIYKHSWMSYPLNVLFTSMVMTNSVIIAKHIIPEHLYSKKTLFKTTGLLALQFIFGLPICFLLVYKIFPWYNEKSEIEKVFIAGLSPLFLSIPKVILRTAVTKFNLVHPGVLHLLIGTLYTAAALVFRVMQAELVSFWLFVALGAGHAVVDLIERLTVSMRDYIWEYAYKLLSRCCRSRPRDFPAGITRTPRSMRFVADVSIQLVLTEANALVSAVGFSQLYNFMYPDEFQTPDGYFESLIWQFLARCVTGLAIDVFFNTVSLWLQAMYLNVAVLKVWRSKQWRYHVISNVVCTIMVVLYFTEYLFAIVRGKNNGKKFKRFAFNCSLPFSKF